MPTTPAALWTPRPERIERAELTAFARAAGVAGDFGDLHRWSLEKPDELWRLVWDRYVRAGDPGDTTIARGETLPDTRFFPDATLSFAENLLQRRGDDPAILTAREDGARATTSWDELRTLVARIQQALVADGVTAGDRVAAWLPNTTETYALMLAASSIGAVFSSTSPDFGVTGVADRFRQIEPVVLVATDGYTYAGKTHRRADLVPAIAAELPTLRRTVVLEHLDDGTATDVPGAIGWRTWLDPHPGGEPTFAQLPFDHPLAILYSSGTTGAPKCIVHRAGGILLKHLTEHRLHCDVRPGDRVFYFTTAGWMMWNWLASALASDATLVVYDGSPVHPRPDSLFGLAADLGVTLFGTSAKFIDGCRKAGLRPGDDHDLSSVRTITSTGSPLVAEGFTYVYEAIASDVHLASISGGTDLCGCLVAGDPTGPVYAGEIQRPALGLDIAVLDDEGRPVEPGDHGELVCRNAFPSMPLGFWNDPDQKRYRAAYFERFDGCWHQGDFCEPSAHGGFVITGRSDATLNPGGVRIGTAEIYRIVEGFDEVVESLVVGQRWDDDVRIVLFVVLRPGIDLDDDLVGRLRSAVRTGASPRHVPAKVIAVPELPRTRSGKLVELAVRAIIDGGEVANVAALANPEALDHFRDRPELAS